MHSFLDSHFLSSPSDLQQAFLQSFLHPSFSWSQHFSVQAHLSLLVSEANKEVDEVANNAAKDKLKTNFFIRRCISVYAKLRFNLIILQSW